MTIQLESAGPPVGFELYARKRRRSAEPPLVRCPSDCTVYLPPGRYRLLVSPSAETRLSAKRVDIDRPVRLRVEPPPRSRYVTGMTLGFIGLPLLTAGLGLSVAAAAEHDPDFDDRRAEFWIGTGMFLTGAALVPTGFALAASLPGVDEQAIDPAHRRGEPDYEPTASRRIDVVATEDGGPPAGYRTETRRGRGLIIAGAAVAVPAYALSTLIAGIAFGSPDAFVSELRPLAIPVVGGLFIDHEDSASILFALTLPQVVGSGLLVAGLASQKNVWVRDWGGSNYRIGATPLPGGGALSLRGDL